MQQRASAPSAAIMLTGLLKDVGELGHVVCGWGGWSSWVAMKQRMCMLQRVKEHFRRREEALKYS